MFDAESISINDRYLRSTRGYSILVKLLSTCEKLKSLTIFTILRDNVEKDNFDMTCKDFKTRLNNLFPQVNISIEKTNNEIGKDRFLKTENFQISFQPGIDFVEENYIAEKNPITIDIIYLHSNELNKKMFSVLNE